MTRPALRLVDVVAFDDIYVTSPAHQPRVVKLDGLSPHAVDRLGVVDALVVLPERVPRSEVRRKGEMDLEEWR